MITSLVKCELLGEAVVNQIYLVLVLSLARGEISRLHVSVQKALIVDVLQELYSLHREDQRCLDCELPADELAQVIERRPEQLCYDHVVLTFHPSVVNLWNAFGVASKEAEHFSFVEQNGLLGVLPFLRSFVRTLKFCQLTSLMATLSFVTISKPSNTSPNDPALI